MKREIKLKSYIRQVDGSVIFFIWDVFKHNVEEGRTLIKGEEIIECGLEFIGIKDKNGVEIFAGDIVQTDGYTGKVQYCHQAAQWHIVWQSGKSTRYMPFNANYGDDTGYYCDYLEIIGNIYESPELIKQ